MSESLQNVDIHELQMEAEEVALRTFLSRGIEPYIPPHDQVGTQERSAFPEDIEETLDILDLLLEAKGRLRSIYANSFELTNTFALTHCSLKTENYRNRDTNRVHLLDQQLLVWRDENLNVLLRSTECDQDTEELWQVSTHYGSFYYSQQGLRAAYRADIRNKDRDELLWRSVYEGAYGPVVDECESDRIDLAVSNEFGDVTSVYEMISTPYTLLREGVAAESMHEYLLRAQSIMESSRVSPE